MVASIATVGAFAAGLPWGLEGVATAYLLATLVLQPTFLWLTTRSVGISPLDWLRSLAGILQAGLGMLLGVLAARAALLETSLPVAARLAAVVLVGALIYVPLVAWRAPEVMQELRSLRARRREASGPPAPEGAQAQV
jgi:PST family polysaccharide transporter